MISNEDDNYFRHISTVLKDLSDESRKPIIIDNEARDRSSLLLFFLTQFSSYKDVYFPEQDNENLKVLRHAYCKHALSLVMKTRAQVIANNELLKASDKAEFLELRDQGLTRPKVLILLPFRESAFQVINNLIRLVKSEADSIEKKTTLMNYKKYKREYYAKSVIRSTKPSDFNLTFAGNTDDSFRIGISITKHSFKLFADFYSSDIIVASPLGLRILIGADGDKERDFDYLNSIELLILDQTEIFLMQNWEHVIDIINHLHIKPTDPRGIDFSRVRPWVLDAQQKYYRQTLILSSVDTLAAHSLLTKRCHNYEGSIIVKSPSVPGQIRLTVTGIKQTFLRFESKSLLDSIDARFKFFIERVLKDFQETSEPHVMVYIPSYFDYVKLRNYFRKEDINFTQICEYTGDGKIAQSRAWFFHGGRNILLYTERCHFYKRYNIKGIRHLIFYQLPTFPKFYTELVNLVTPPNQGKKFSGDESCLDTTVLFDQYDVKLLEPVVGTEKSAEMLYSELDSFTITAKSP